MEKRLSANVIKQHIRTRISKLGNSNILISGSFVRTSRKCGNVNCHCATGVRKHPCCLLTSKVRGKTKAVYIPVDMEEEVESWVKEYKKVKRLLKEIDKLSEQLIRQHVSVKRAVNKNLELLNR